MGKAEQGSTGYNVSLSRASHYSFPFLVFVYQTVSFLSGVSPFLSFLSQGGTAGF